MQVIAKRACGFDMKILYHNRSGTSPHASQYAAEYRPLPQLLAESDFVVIITPLTDSTCKLIGKEQLAQMKKSAYLINVARGKSTLNLESKIIFQKKKAELWIRML